MHDSKVLLVIDLQNDYLWDKRKPMFTYASPAFRGHMKTKNYKEVARKAYVSGGYIPL